MGLRRSVVFNGDLGSGKSTVSRMLAERLGLRRISVGDLYREMAARRGMTALQLNVHAELDEKVDHQVDQLQRDAAASGERLVVDSRLAWHFFTDALKVHFIADPAVAAERAMRRPAGAVESYTSVGQARERLAVRSAKERSRFLARYGVDKARLGNYDLVCDSTSATPGELVERIVAHLGDAPGVTTCYLDPRRVRCAGDVARGGEVLVGYRGREFFAVSGRERLLAAAQAGDSLVPARLADEGRLPPGG